MQYDEGSNLNQIAYSPIRTITCDEIPMQYTYNLTYDAYGNLLQGMNNYYEYDDFNRLTTVREGDQNGDVIEEHLYDAEGNRVRKITYHEGGTNTTTYYIGEGFVAITNSTGTYYEHYYYADGQLVAKNESGTMKYFHGDHLGSTTLITDENGDLLKYIEYLPYGASLVDFNEERLYAGQKKDDTELYYYGARYYDPELRRFTTADPIIDPFNPQNLNRYHMFLTTRTNT